MESTHRPGKYPGVLITRCEPAPASLTPARWGSGSDRNPGPPAAARASISNQPSHEPSLTQRYGREQQSDSWLPQMVG